MEDGTKVSLTKLYKLFNTSACLLVEKSHVTNMAFEHQYLQSVRDYYDVQRSEVERSSDCK